MYDLRSMTQDELRNMLDELGEPAFRARQLFAWLQARGAESFDEMTDLSKSLREKLAGCAELRCAHVAHRYDSQLDDTHKYLFALNDGEYIESVLMHYHHGCTICISTQVGCRMGCTFAQRAKAVSAAVCCRPKWSRRCSRCSAIRVCAFPTSCSWAWGSRWIILKT